MFERAVLASIVLVGCANEPSVPVRVSLVPMTSARVATAGMCPFGVTCLTPTELSVKLTAVYLAEGIDASGTNVGATQAVYASPECDGIEGRSGEGVQDQPNLGSCSIDVGLTSSSSPPQTITKSPRYIDLAAGRAAVDAALDAGRFAVAPGTYQYLRLDAGSNAPQGQFNGNQDVSPPGTAMNFRFQAGAMAAPYEIRRLLGVDVAFPAPVTLTADQSVDIELGYSVVGTVYEVTMGSGTPGDPTSCTPAVDGKRYCLEVGFIQFSPSLVVAPTLAQSVSTGR